MAELRTHYDNLQVARDASEAVIRAAYRVLMQKHHPDKNLEDAESAHARITIINRAYEVLSDPQQRAEYDAWVKQQEGELSQNGSAARERELLLKQQELARRVRQEERRRQQAEDELERVRAEFIKEKALARLRTPPTVQHQPALLTADPAPQRKNTARRKRTLWRAAAGAAAVLLALGVWLAAGDRTGDAAPAAAPPARASTAAAVAPPAAPPPVAPAMTVERHGSRKSAEQALAASGAKPWNEAAVAALERNQMWGPNLHGGAENFFIKIRNDGGDALAGVLFELSNQACDKPVGAKVAYYLFRLRQPLDPGQGASYAGSIGLNPDYARNPSGMCGSIVSAW